MIKIYRNKIFVILLMIGIMSCGGTKKSDINDEYKKYKISQGIKGDSTLPFQHFKDFLVFKKEQNKQSLLKDLNLKVNKVYVYQGDDKVFTFCVYSDDGHLYMAEAYTREGLFLADAINGEIILNKSIELLFLGFFELEGSTIRISRHKKTSSGVKNQSDLGYITKDTITLSAFYNTKKYSYTKKWLAKTYKTNFKLVYQPNLRAKKIKNEFGVDTFLVDGSFKEDR